MRDPKRIKKTLSGIENIWNKHPDLRLGQLICNIVRDPTLYYIEDEDLVKILNEYYK